MLILTANLSSWERKKARERFRAGQLLKLRTGIYADSAAFHRLKPWERYRLECMATAISRPGSVLVGKSAAALWEVPYGEIPRYVEMAREQGSGGFSSKGVKSRELLLPGQLPILGMAAPYERAKVAGLPQTLIDIARWYELEHAVIAIDACLNKRKVHRRDLEQVLDMASGWGGVKQARKALKFAHSAAESPRESQVRLQIWRAGLPAPHLQASIRNVRGEFIGRVDFFYPKYSLAIEYDGRIKYEGAFGQSKLGALEDERFRERDLLNTGLRMIRIDRESFRDGSWLSVLKREIERSAGADLSFPEQQWDSAGPAW